MFGLPKLLETEFDYRAFLRWWGLQLAFLVPGKVRLFLWPQRPSLLIRPVSGQLLVFVYESDNLRELGLFPVDDSGAQARAALFAEYPDLRDADQVLMLTEDISLLRRCKLPYAAMENLHQVVGFELDRLTPFKSEQVYYSARILERVEESKQLRIEVALVLRDTLDPLLQAMLRCGWKPFRADIDGDVALTRRHELLPESFRIPRKRGPLWVAAAAGGVLMAVVGIALWLPLTMGETMASRLQAEIKAGNKVVAEVEALKTGAERIRINANFIRRKKREEPRMLDMLEELTRILPDNTWLNGLQYDEHKLLVQGQSPNATELIEELEDSPYFQDVKFASPITKDANRIERFQISATVINGRAN